MKGKQWFHLMFIVFFACSVSTPAFALTDRPSQDSNTLSAPQSQPAPNARDMQFETGEIDPIDGTDSH
jgi:hypothetical protein